MNNVMDNFLQMVTKCYTVFDGYFSETILATVIGALWLCWANKQIRKLEKLDSSSWITQKKRLNPVKDELLLT